MENKWVNNNVVEFIKGRSIDLNKNVEVYRRLNKKGKTYTVKQNGVVIGYTSQLKLKDAKFVIRKSGKEKCKITGINNSHALVRGKVDVSNTDNEQKTYKVTYDPFLDETFMCHTSGEPFEIHRAETVLFTNLGIFVIPID